MNISFKIGAESNVGMVRKNNEDNFTVSADLSQGWHWVNDQQYSLGQLGALLVVADGMGGMNAGEVASEIAIQTVQQYFTLEHILSEVRPNDPNSIVNFMNKVIVKADENIKIQARQNAENQGMGTTIVVAWLLGDKLYVSWCGDSRAYVFNPAFGLHQLTVDHSYVQSLVEKGALSRYAAFDFPESNIITRSLCDAIAEPAKPEALAQPYTVADGDIILLCTDGLCGMIRDNQIQSVIENSPDDMGILVKNLISAACQAAGSDNVTAIACEIISGGGAPMPQYFTPIENRLNGVAGANAAAAPSANSTKPTSKSKTDFLRDKKVIALLAALVVVALVGLSVFFLFGGSDEEETKEATTTIEDENINAQDDEMVPYDVSGSVGSFANPAANALQGAQQPQQPQQGTTPEQQGGPTGNEESNPSTPSDAEEAGPVSDNANINNSTTVTTETGVNRQESSNIVGALQNMQKPDSTTTPQPNDPK